MIKTMDDARVCPSCCCNHQIDFHCKPTFLDSSNRICSKNCTRNACKHDEAPSFTVSKLGSNKSIPLVESIDKDSSSFGIQYDLGSQMWSDLQVCPAKSISRHIH